MSEMPGSNNLLAAYHVETKIPNKRLTGDLSYSNPKSNLTEIVVSEMDLSFNKYLKL